MILSTRALSDIRKEPSGTALRQNNHSVSAVKLQFSDGLSWDACTWEWTFMCCSRLTAWPKVLRQMLQPKGRVPLWDRRTWTSSPRGVENTCSKQVSPWEPWETEFFPLSCPKHLALFDRRLSLETVLVRLSCPCLVMCYFF